MRKILAKIPRPLPMTATKFGLIGVPSALSTWIIYGCQTVNPQNSLKNCKQNMSKHGFKFRFCFNSLILSKNVDFRWLQLNDCFEQVAHGSEDPLNSWRLVNSFWMVRGGTQPRSHCNDCWASLNRRFDINHDGDSGTCDRNSWVSVMKTN